MIKTVRTWRHNALVGLLDMGVPGVLLQDLGTLARLNYGLAYSYKTRPIVLPFWLGVGRWLQELNQEASTWLD